MSEVKRLGSTTRPLVYEDARTWRLSSRQRSLGYFNQQVMISQPDQHAWEARTGEQKDWEEKHKKKDNRMRGRTRQENKERQCFLRDILIVMC